MNPTLTTCLFGTILVAGATAALTLVAGAGLLAAFAVYSLGGSLMLVGATLATMPGDPAPRTAVGLPAVAQYPSLTRVLA